MIKKTNFKFNLGEKVCDTITNFEGIVTWRAQWLNNCNTYGVQSQILKDGLPQESQKFDEPQIKSVKKNVYKPKRTTGGPQRNIPINGII